ncbi:hypothetical protein Q5425_43860 [Amycolatopsis sp. A133]|uniref:hypothetical protein n=1 Tax=Amycolatopsis sp. A133 TaxID=3064472 RepID=UPI0027FD6E6C|nr:hypothetical protein [Amycolatopsis sp. A133]MDQ7810705.1 hypothetical protein [Amycolatopsis sp. A133]
MALDDRWAHLRDAAFVVKTERVEVHPVAHDRDGERRLREATAELLGCAGVSRYPGRRGVAGSL